MTRGLGGKAPANVQSYLKGVHYPANKNDLVTAARDNGAPKEIIELIQDLTEEEFGGPQDVMKAYGELGEEQRKAS
ncbi:MAG: DUF2795 domain-containing protein [Minicystis sp.]